MLTSCSRSKSASMRSQFDCAAHRRRLAKRATIRWKEGEREGIERALRQPAGP
jgi:hypothetical protein